MSAADLVLRWAALYTRGLDPAIAGDRRDELASDMWEHAAQQPRAGAAILSRAIRGVPADLVWRFEEHRRVRALVPIETRVVGSTVAVLVALAASSLIVFGLIAIQRTAFFVSQQYVRPWSETAVWVIGLTALAVVGALLLLRRRTRPLGAIALAASSPLLHFGLYDLYSKSATVAQLSSAPGWSVAVVCIMACLVLLFVAAAVLWTPSRKDAA
jgi:hypothetical protein